MNDFTDFSNLDLEEDADVEFGNDAAPLLDQEFDAPAPGSIEEAALKIDALMQDGDFENGGEAGDDFEKALAQEGEGEDLPDAAGDDPLVAVDIDGEEAEVPLSELTEAFLHAGETHKASEAITQRTSDIESALEATNEELTRLIPVLRHQLSGAFGDVRSPQDLAVMAQVDPARYGDLHARLGGLSEAERYADTLSQFQREQTIAAESEELAKLVPELVDPKGGEQLRQDIVAYGSKQGFDEQRFADAGAAEIAILHKAMKYDRLQEGQAKAARRAQSSKRARPVMRPGQARGDDPQAAYRKAMAQLKKTGHVDDAARVIELML